MAIVLPSMSLVFSRVMSDSGEKVKKTSRIDASTEACFLKCGITNNLDGSEDELVYNSTENTHELDDSSIKNLFESDPESEFEGFVV